MNVSQISNNVSFKGELRKIVKDPGELPNFLYNKYDSDEIRSFRHGLDVYEKAAKDLPDGDVIEVKIKKAQLSEQDFEKVHKYSKSVKGRLSTVCRIIAGQPVEESTNEPFYSSYVKYIPGPNSPAKNQLAALPPFMEKPEDFVLRIKANMQLGSQEFGDVFKQVMTVKRKVEELKNAEKLKNIAEIVKQ